MVLCCAQSLSHVRLFATLCDILTDGTLVYFIFSSYMYICFMGLPRWH